MSKRCLILVVLALICTSAFGYEGQRANSVLLNGQWQYVEGDGSEAADTAAGQAKLTWLPTTLPGDFVPFVKGEPHHPAAKLVWAKRTFQVSAEQATKLAVLRWNHIAFGAVAYINGQKVGENAPSGPYQVVLSKGALQAGENSIVLKIPGAASLPKGASGFILIDAGFANTGPDPKGMPAVQDDVWIDFSDTAYIKWALSLPDLAGSKVGVRVTPTGPEAIDDLKIAVRVKFSDGTEMGQGEATMKYTPSDDPLGGESTTVEVPMPNFKPWTHEDCNLYTATVQLLRQGKVLDEVSFRFGMREFKVVNDRFQLNGRDIYLRGSDLVGEWNWPQVDLNSKVKEYLVTEAREMSMNSFRTHTVPLPRAWADVCDENGTMILAEFPNTYNDTDPKLTPEEYKTFRKNLMTDAAGWMGRLWNHPSVVLWILSNESSVVPENRVWESGPFQDFVLKLDPTRPTMRTGDIGATKFCRDMHDCGDTYTPVELDSLPKFEQWKNESVAQNVTYTNTEYMNFYAHPATQWAGPEGAEVKGTDAVASAQVAMEHTEYMRREQFDGLWPFMYAGWTKARTGKEWKAGFAAPISAGLHSALSPVLASLELYNANYLPGQDVTTELYLINDSWHDGKMHVDLLLTKECPEYIPEAECFNTPIAKWSYDYDVKADTMTKTPVQWKLPTELGSYWLTARTTAVAATPCPTWPVRAVLSQRFVRSVRTPEMPREALQRTFVLIGADDEAKAWFNAAGLKISEDLTNLDPAKNLVLVWNFAAVTKAQRLEAMHLRQFAAAGGRIVVLAATQFDWGDLCDVAVGKPQGSRVYPTEGVTHPLMAGIAPDSLCRWNGIPGLVATGSLTGRVLDQSQNILWVVEPKSVVAAEVPTLTGDGTMLFVLLDIPEHLDKTKPSYDPAAESILMNILGLPPYSIGEFKTK